MYKLLIINCLELYTTTKSEMMSLNTVTKLLKKFQLQWSWTSFFLHLTPNINNI